MSQSIHKRSFSESYTSEEEEIDVNNLQKEFERELSTDTDSTNNSDSESVASNCETFGLKIGDTFENWDLAIKHVEKHAMENGFEVVKQRLQKNKKNEIVRRTFECKHSREYHAKKKADVEDNRERESVKINCPWKVNLYLTDVVRITSMCDEHNHPLLDDIQNVAPKFHRLNSEMLEEVEFLVNIGCGAGPIICGLQKRFPDAIIHPKNVYNAINIFRRNKRMIKTDAAETYEKLMRLQREEHGWFVEAKLEGEDNHLTGLFWMRPSQIDLWRRFHDVAINDNTAQTNRYRMYLSLTIIVDNNMRSRIAATAIVADETKETYQWILECLLRATGIAPRVLFTDADAGMIAAVHETLPSTKHNYCIWHIRKNIEKNLKGKLCSKYSNFVKEWNKCRNSFSETEFKNRWRDLLTNYPEAKSYLERTLGVDVTSWALCYTHRSFNGGTQSTQRAESYNSLIKRSLKVTTTLYELDTQIQLQLDREEKFEREEQKSKNPTIGLPNVIDRFFKPINLVIKKYLTPRVLKMQHCQMNECLLYCVKKVENWEDLLGDEVNDEEIDIQEMYSEDQEEKSYNEEENNNTDPIGMTEVTGNIEFAEDNYESMILNLDSLIKCINRTSIHEAMFHIGLIPARWYNSETTNDPQKEAAITIFSKKSSSDDREFVYEHPIEPNFDILNEIRNVQMFSETVKQNLSHKVKYNQGIRYAKKAVNLALEMGCEDELNKLLQDWIKVKERTIRDNLSKSNKENLPNISNPRLVRTKGAPKKRVKSALENTTTKYHNKGKEKIYATANSQDTDHISEAILRPIPQNNNQGSKRNSNMEIQGKYLGDNERCKMNFPLILKSEMNSLWAS
ncbi:unnamed protein product [Rhizophagus irregularis]|nr:unnamed protein product [Rhizophagus irregularis]